MQKFDPTVMFKLFETFNVPANTRELIITGFQQPARWTTATPYHAPSDLPCPKMGFVIHAANALERQAAMLYQFSNDVLGYIDSPFTLHVKVERKGKCTTEYNWAHGFLVITEQGFVWEDWAPFASLMKKCKSNPGRFVRDGDSVRSPPLEDAATRLGIKYRLRTDREIDPVAARNREFLRSYLVDAVSMPEWFRSELREYFQINGYATLEELRQALPHRTLDHFHTALAGGHLTTDLSRAAVQETDKFMVFRDAQTMENYRQSGLWAEAHASHFAFEPDTFSIGQRVFIAGNPFTIVSAGNVKLVLQPETGGQLVSMRNAVVEAAVREGTVIVERPMTNERDPLRLDSPLRFASAKAVKQAIQKLNLLDRWEAGQRTDQVAQYSDRTYRTWRRLRNEAVANGADTTLALVPAWHARGNRNPRLDPEIEKTLTHIIKTRFENLAGRNKWSVYGDLVRELQKSNLTISKQTFLVRVKRAQSVQTIAKRQGRKAAYQAQPFYWWLERETPVHGDFPMQWVHIDHTPLQIEVVWAKTGESLGRPTLTLMMCAYSRRVVGFYLSLLSPRYICCMAAVLDMIRRTGRVPDGIIFDGGAEFFSRDFESMLDFLRIEKHPRKTSAPRDGSVLERAFGWTQTMLIDNLPGNTKLRRNVRELTSETDPSRLATCTLAQLYDGLEELFCDLYEKRRHSTLLMSPAQMFELGLERSGRRLHRLKNLEDCIPHVFPSVRGYSRTIDAQRGVRTNYGQYHNTRLESAMYDGLVVPTKYHPIDPKVIYVFVGNEWVPMTLSRNDETWRASTFFNMAHLEEQRMLESLTRDSQNDANVRISALIERMNLIATDDANVVHGIARGKVTTEPSCSASTAVDAENGATPDAGRTGASTLADTMKALIERGYSGKRF